MDLMCPRCGEPWELDYFHDVASEYGSTFAEVSADFRRRGCEAVGEIHNYRCECGHTRVSHVRVAPRICELCACEEFNRSSDQGLAPQLASAAYDLMGDDVDGAASMLDDAAYLLREE